MNRITHLVFDYLVATGLSQHSAEILNMMALLVAALVLIFIIEYVSRFILITAFNQFASKTKTNLDDILVSNRVLKNIAHFIPLFFALELTSYVFVDFPTVEKLVEKGLDLFCIVLILWIIKSILNTIKDYAQTFKHLRDKPLNSYVQVFMIFAWIIGFMFAYSYLTGTTIWKFFTVLGAASAVIILVFKDTILGFVASIQVSINDMVRIGDWITFDKYATDGDVIEITLATVKVQNFDKTITTIPTYASFQQRYCASTSSAARSWMRLSRVAGARPSAAGGRPNSIAWRTVAARISKNSSRLVQEMHRKRSRSSNGTDGSCAWASTRKLKSSCDSSRLRYSAGRAADRVRRRGDGGQWRMAAVMAVWLGAGRASGMASRGCTRSGPKRQAKVLPWPTSLSISSRRLVQAQHVLDDGQAQPGAAGFARAAGGHAVEAFGDARQVRGRDAVAAVAHRQRGAAVGRRARSAMVISPPAGRVAHRVADQVGEGAVQFLGASPHRSHAGGRPARGSVPALAERLGLAAQRGQHRRHRHVSSGRRVLRFQPRQGQQVLDQLGHALRLPLHLRRASAPIPGCSSGRACPGSRGPRSAACAVRARRWRRNRGASVPAASAW